MRGVPLTLLAMRVAAGGDGCLWADPLIGVDKQCMGLLSAPGGRISREACEAYCCAHRSGPGGLPMENGQHCDLWQWMGVAVLPDASYKSTCFLGK